MHIHNRVFVSFPFGRSEFQSHIFQFFVLIFWRRSHSLGVIKTCGIRRESERMRLGIKTGGTREEGKTSQNFKKRKKRRPWRWKREKRAATWGLSKALRAVAIPETYSGLWFTVTTEQLVKVHHNWDGSPGPFHTSSGFSIKVVKIKKNSREN